MDKFISKSKKEFDASKWGPPAFIGPRYKEIKKEKGKKKIEVNEGMKEGEGEKGKGCQVLYFGYNATIAGGWPKAIDRVLNHGCNALQIFLTGSKITRAGHFPSTRIAEMRDAVQQAGIPVFVHLPYMLLLGGDAGPVPQYIDCILWQLDTISKIGGRGGVLHMGRNTRGGRGKTKKKIAESKEKQFSDDESRAFMAHNVALIANRMDVMGMDPGVTLILETCCGSGNSVFGDIAHLGVLYNTLTSIQQARVSFCIDTCHIHAAGYDIRTPTAARAFKELFSSHVPWSAVSLIHFNDSIDPFGSCKDNHETIGFGEIGLPGLLEIAQIAKEDGIPLILETPTSRTTPFFDEIALIKNRLD